MNMANSIKQYILGGFFCLLTIGLQAQEGAEFGGFLGVAHYFGDLNTDFALKDPGYAVGVIGRYNFNERTAIKLAGSIAKVSAYDFDSNNTFEQRRNLDFQSKILDISAQFEFNFLPYVHGSSGQYFTPYLFAGFSVTNFNPQTEVCSNSPTTPASQCNGGTSLVDLRPLGTEGQFKGEEYFTTTGGLAFGAGFKYSINYEWSINVELSGRRLFTDYLDDVSGTYADIDDLQNLRGPLAVALSDRSSPAIGGKERKKERNGRQNVPPILRLLLRNLIGLKKNQFK